MARKCFVAALRSITAQLRNLSLQKILQVLNCFKHPRARILYIMSTNREPSTEFDMSKRGNKRIRCGQLQPAARKDYIERKPRRWECPMAPAAGLTGTETG